MRAVLVVSDASDPENHGPLAIPGLNGHDQARSRRKREASDIHNGP
jgi:hypothetical protein